MLRQAAPHVEIPSLSNAEDCTGMSEEVATVPSRRARIFRRNTSRDLRNSAPLPPIERRETIRPQSARIVRIGDTIRDDHNLREALYEKPYGGRSGTFDREYEARNVSSAPVVMTPETISRCICVLIMELMEGDEGIHNDMLSAISPMEGPSSEKAFFSSSPAKPSQYDVFRRDYKSASSSHSQASTKLFSPVKLTSFFSTKKQIPSHKALTTFFTKVCIDTQMEYECAIISLIYITRLVKLSSKAFRLNEDTWRGALLACMLVANKVWDDFAMFNADYCCIFNGLTLSRINELELKLLRLLMTDLHVTASQFAVAHFMVQDLVTKEEIRRVTESASNNQMGSVDNSSGYCRRQRKVALSRNNSSKSPCVSKEEIATGSKFGITSCSDSDRLSIIVSDSNVTAMVSGIATRGKAAESSSRAIDLLVDTNDSDHQDTADSNSEASVSYVDYCSEAKKKPMAPSDTPPDGYRMITGCGGGGGKVMLPDQSYIHPAVVHDLESSPPFLGRTVVSPASSGLTLGTSGLENASVDAGVSPSQKVTTHSGDCPTLGRSYERVLGDELVCQPNFEVPVDNSLINGIGCSSDAAANSILRSTSPDKLGYVVKHGSDSRSMRSVEHGDCVRGSHDSCCMPFLWNHGRVKSGSRMKWKSKKTVIPTKGVFSPSEILRRNWEERHRQKQERMKRRKDDSVVSDI